MSAIPQRNRPRGRPRAAETDRVLTEAARELLAEGGFEALSFEALSQSTGISRATIYRRWPSRAHLAGQIANGEAGAPAERAAGGDLRAALHAVIADVFAHYSRPDVGAASIGLITSYQREPTLRDELHTPFETAARDDLRGQLARFAGELRADTDPDVVFDLIVGALLFRLLFSSLDATNGLVESITDTVVSGIAGP